MRTFSILVGSLLFLLLYSCGLRAKQASDPGTPGEEAGTKLQLEGQWLVQGMYGEAWVSGLPVPELEIRLQENQYLGTDGCNRYMGSIARVGMDSLRFGLAAGTRMACPDMDQSDRYTAALRNCATYEVEGDILTLFDEAGKEILRFRHME